MKQPIRTGIVLLGLLLFSYQTLSADDKTDKPNPLIGTWKQQKSKLNDAPEYQDIPEAQTRLKIITTTHYVWVDFPVDDKKIRNSAGGRYTLKGENYVETIEFGFERMTNFFGKEQKFTVKVDGDTLHQKGVLSNGNKLDEIWVRVK